VKRLLRRTGGGLNLPTFEFRGSSRCASRPSYGPAVYGVLKHKHRRLTIPIDDQFVRTPLVSGDGDHILEDDVFGQEIEEMAAVNEACQSLLDDAAGRGTSGRGRAVSRLWQRHGPAEEGVQRGEVGWVVDGRGQLDASTFHAVAFRLAKSWKLAGGLPVTFSISRFGREPLPEIVAPVSHRSTTA
jgi:hypothetical protein